MGILIRFILTVYVSTPDRDNGYCHYALRMTDKLTDKSASVITHDGYSDSNIYGILRSWTDPDDWDRSVHYSLMERIKRRTWNEVTKGWETCNGNSKELSAWLKEKLGIAEEVKS